MSGKVRDEEPSIMFGDHRISHKMRVDNTGQWSGAIRQNDFDLFSIISEGLNNIEHSDSVVIDIKLGKLRIEGEIYRAYSLIESGGIGFPDKEKFIEAITWGSSNKSGLNNFGTGFKCECMMRQTEDDSVYKVMKIDTGISCGISWSSNGLREDIPDEKELSEDYIIEKFPSMSKRVTLAVWGKNSEKLNEKVLIENIYNIDYSEETEGVEEETEGVEEEKEGIIDLLNRRYGRCLSKITYNDLELKDNDFFNKCLAKDHHCLVGGKTFDNMIIEYYEKNGKSGIKCEPEGDFHGKQKPFWITTNKQPKILQYTCNLDKDTPIAVINMQIMEHRLDEKGDKRFPLVKNNIYCEMNNSVGGENIILCEERFKSDWGKGSHNPIHLLLRGNGEWLNLQANKTRSRLKPKLLELISKMVNSYYLTGDHKDNLTPAFHELKTKKTDIPLDTRDDEIENIISWQKEQEYFIEIEEEGYFRCMCCQGLICNKAEHKMNSCAMGHIESAKKKKENGGEDDISSQNLVPICEHCNSNMGTMNMTEYIKQKFGKKSNNYKLYEQYCMKRGKSYLPTDINSRGPITFSLG
jgi:hypothetical protein